MAQEKKQSLIFLPSHKSHIDYLVVSYLMYRLGMESLFFFFFLLTHKKEKEN